MHRICKGSISFYLAILGVYDVSVYRRCESIAGNNPRFPVKIHSMIRWSLVKGRRSTERAAEKAQLETDREGSDQTIKATRRGAQVTLDREQNTTVRQCFLKLV